jgi:hypothetical protein
VNAVSALQVHTMAERFDKSVADLISSALAEMDLDVAGES